MQRCPTEDDINNAPERPVNEDDWDPDVEYKQELRAKRQRIIEATRSMEKVDTEDARLYLTRELKTISTIIGNRFYLDNHIARHPATDTSIKQVNIRRIGGGIDLSSVEAITTRSQDVVLHSYSWQTAEVYYYVAGPAGTEKSSGCYYRLISRAKLQRDSAPAPS
ncbi:hypothetical protein [Marinobacter antarcticus]|uniref:hypothetical protein n=1 Tax=Marinobacter antarcticus TaxID=564117 RepID=UPI0009335AE0|nr:hypothetical protein [Marinobacter antarcticus]